jgi:hexosaminidase
VPNHSRKTGEGWFYSQEEVKELVAYAASRYVTIVPEIEMPGHSGAAIASYPELACGGKHPGGWSAPLCVSQDAVLRFAKDVLDEVVAIFPSPYIHVGADEVRNGPWRNCQTCKPAMEKLMGEKRPDDVTTFRVPNTDPPADFAFREDNGRLQGEFVRTIDRHITLRGRRMVGWDEILDSGLRNNSTAAVMAWRGYGSAIGGATGQKRDVIVAVWPEYYLDNNTPLQRTYGHEPIPANLPAGEEAHVLGVQANMWGEGTPTIEQVDMRSFPRLCALSEVAWTPREARNFEDFSARLKLFRVRLELLGVRMKE